MHHTTTSIWRFAATMAVAGILALPGAASAATAEEILERNLEVTGGHTAHNAVTSGIIKADASIPDFGLEMTLVIYYKDGNYLQAIEVPGMGEMREGLTGDVAWQMNPMEGDAILDGAAAEYMRFQAALNPLVGWQKRFASAEIAGEEDGATAVVLKTPGGYEATCYFDNASGLMTKQEGLDASGMSTTTTYSDEKEVAGVSFAHALVIESATATIDTVITSVEFNAEIDDSIFDLPEAIAALQTGEPAAGITAEQVMAMMDANGDGKISMDEAPEQLQAAFAMVDVNADEGIDVEEAQSIADFMNN